MGELRRTDTGCDEGGFTLIEVMVAMVIFGIVMVIVGDAVGLAARYDVRQQNTDQSASQVDDAFLQLDSEIRYATEISSTPYNLASGNPAVQFEADWTTSTLGSPQCTELEYFQTAGKLEQRVWLLGAGVPTTWEVLASGLAPTPATYPFSLSSTGSQLSLTLADSAGGGAVTGTGQSAFTMTALNTPTPPVVDPTKVCGGVAP